MDRTDNLAIALSLQESRRLYSEQLRALSVFYSKIGHHNTSEMLAQEADRILSECRSQSYRLETDLPETGQE